MKTRTMEESRNRLIRNLNITAGIGVLAGGFSMMYGVNKISPLEKPAIIRTYDEIKTTVSNLNSALSERNIYLPSLSEGVKTEVITYLRETLGEEFCSICHLFATCNAIVLFFLA